MSYSPTSHFHIPFPFPFPILPNPTFFPMPQQQDLDSRTVHVQCEGPEKGEHSIHLARDQPFPTRIAHCRTRVPFYGRHTGGQNYCDCCHAWQTSERGVILHSTVIDWLIVCLLYRLRVITLFIGLPSYFHFFHCGKHCPMWYYSIMLLYLKPWLLLKSNTTRPTRSQYLIH